MLAFIGIVVGIALLITGGGILVRGASEIAVGFGVSPMVVGLTIVGFGTSSPELIISTISALDGQTGIAFGNVIGSNISNLGLVLGTAAIISPIAIQGELVRRELPLLLLAISAITVMALDGPLEGTPALIGRTDSIILLLLFCIFVYIIVLDFIRVQRHDPLLDDIDESAMLSPPEKGRLRWLLVIGGCTLLFIGGEITVRNAVTLATEMGLSTTIVGLFVVAVGTSMPELVTSIIAAVRGESDLALGNVIGSNIFNSLMVLPISGAIMQIPVPVAGVMDLIVSWLLAAALIPIFFLRKAILGRAMGVVFLGIYLAYAAVRITQT